MKLDEVVGNFPQVSDDHFQVKILDLYHQSFVISLHCCFYYVLAAQNICFENVKSWSCGEREARATVNLEHFGREQISVTDGVLALKKLLADETHFFGTFFHFGQFDGKF